MKVYHPQINVTLVKTMARTGISFDSNNNPIIGISDRYKQITHKQIDLTEYLGDGGGVRTSKSVREPAGGFVITLLDMMHAEFMESIYALIEPMDMVEIRFCHDSATIAADPTLGGRPPIVMRGFVSEIRRDESMGQDGKPSRRVIISGQDCGKLWQIYLIYYLNNLALGEAFLTQFNFLQKYGTNLGKQQSADAFFKDVIDKLLNPFMASILISAQNDALKSGFIPDCSISGAVSPLIISSFNDCSLYSMLRSVFDVGAFNEMYIEDRADGVAIVLRPSPLCDTANKPIQKGAKVASIPVEENDIQSLTVQRSDTQVGNWFWVQNKPWMLTNDIQSQLLAQSSNVATVDKRSYPNCSGSRFGFRNMHESILLGPPDKLVNDTCTGDVTSCEADNITMQDWLDKRRAVLGDMNKDNAVFESGTMRIRGNERVKAGMMLTVARAGGQTDQYYAVSVDHEFVMYQGFFTTVQFERGTGFINRSQKEKPYLTEWNKGGL